MDIKDLKEDMIAHLNAVFQSNVGENTVTFEVMELESVKRQIEAAPVEVEEIILDENGDIQESGNPESVTVTEVEEVRVVNRVTMNSRKLKIKISNELLLELEKMQLNFKLN